MAVNVVLKSVFDDKGIKQAQNEFAKVGKTLGVAFGAIAAATAAAAATLVKFGADSIAAAENVQQANNRLEQVAKSMNLFGSQTATVTKRLIEFAESNELLVAVDGEVIKATQAKLLTFKNLAQTANEMGGSFDRATMAALDLAAAGFGSAETNAVQLGKALQDPIKGITALARSGVTFTEVEREKIKALVQSGQVLEAQNLILAAIETQVGGTAQATAKASDRMALAFENISESVGMALLPVFNEFANEVVKLTPELEKALAPAAAEIATIFREQVLPALQDFTKWLASPQGTQTLRDLTKGIIDAIKSFIDFVGWVVINKDAIVGFAVAIGSLIVVVKTIDTALRIATATQLLFNAAVLANPYVAAAAVVATGLALIATAYATVYQNAKNVTRELETQRTAILRNENAFVTSATNGASAYKGLIPGLEYTTKTTNALAGQTVIAAHEFAKLDQIKLQNLRREIGESSGELNRFRNIANGITNATTPELPKLPAMPAAESAFEKVQKFIRSAQKELANAQEQYNKTIATAQKRYSEAVLKTEQDFANRLANIVQQSQDRLRTAFEQVVRISLADIFEVEETKSVANLVAGLTTRLAKSQALLEKAGKLNAAGFSQTFIEQVVAAGAETGNELASAILESTPQTQAELQRLFMALEGTAETGMDALAREIYNKQGLATTQLKNLYAQTQTDLNEALKELQLDFNQEVIDANLTLIEAVKKIRESFQENIASMKGDLGGLDKVVTDFLAKLNKVETTAKTQLPVAPSAGGGGGGAVGGGMTGIDVAISTLSNVSGYFIDSISDIAKLISYLNERITAANKFANEAAIAGRTTEAMSAVGIRNELQSQLSILQSLRTMGGAAVGTTININVKTDPSQSLAMVGKTLGNTITKYVTAGGQVLVSPTN